MFFAPFFFAYIIILFLGLAFLFALIEVGIISYAFEQAGLPPEVAFLALLASLVGSYINIPISRITPSEIHQLETVNYFGVRYRIPIRYAERSTVLAVNIGGAVVPTLVVVYLLSHQPASIVPALIATAIVALVVRRFARPVRGLGIATPMFIPPITAALAAYFLAPVHHAGAVAFTSGVLGTLIGADLANLGKIAALGAPVASIGGAGTFDGIFLSGVVAALLT